MPGFFNNLVFLNPWIFAGFAVLPIIWYLLRITPPPPKLIILPTARFLEGLVPDRQTPSHTPWWLLLLRILLAALVLVALAGPVLNPAEKLEGDADVRLVLDNNWAAAESWNDEIKAALETLAEAGRENRAVWIATTAPQAGSTDPLVQGPLPAAQAEAVVRGLKPLPWASDILALEKILRGQKQNRALHSFWFSSGLDAGNLDVLAGTLRAQGGLTFFRPAAAKIPVLLRRSEKADAGKLQMEVAATGLAPPGRRLTVQALGGNGQIIDQNDITLIPGGAATMAFNTPDTLANDIAQMKISGSKGVGGLYLFDSRYQKKTVGLIGPSKETDPKPFIEARFYIRRAIEPFASLREGTPEELLKQNPAVIIMPDVASLPPAALDALERWVRSGGLLLRFAGANMAQSTGETFLVPVKLRGGGRSLSGALSWEKPQKLLPFADSSPLSGITMHENILIRRQILAEPKPDLDQKTWARLEDGTPLITGASMDKGMLVMIHTAATPDWSDLPLSGVFVDVLRRIISMAGHPQSAALNTEGLLEPIFVLDGYGAMHKPDSTVKAIPAKSIEDAAPDSMHPPGLYGQGAYQVALNTGDHIKRLEALSALSGVAERIYGQHFETDLMPYLLYVAFLLLLLDWLIMLLLARGAQSWSMASIFLVLILMPVSAQAQNANDLKYADGLYLAYMESGDPALDALSRKGLENLAAVLNRRTSVEPDGVIGLNPERDTLAFFPFIYWPISPATQSFTITALENIQYYLDHGGTILFDTRDGSNTSGNNLSFSGTDALQRIVGQLNIPALEPIPKNHVLLRSFYLLSDYPGRLQDGTLWVETQSERGRDGVSSVILGSNDWAGSWAEGDPDTLIVGNTRQQELALRFGVNVAMYALTGNYKADQVHVNNILERLGQ